MRDIENGICQVPEKTVLILSLSKDARGQSSATDVDAALPTAADDLR
jgi:hypothetical protein